MGQPRLKRITCIILPKELPRSYQSLNQALDWTAAGGNHTAMDNLEVLYENDEVAVTYHSATSTLGDGVVMALYTKKDGKISQCRIVRQAV